MKLRSLSISLLPSKTITGYADLYIKAEIEDRIINRTIIVGDDTISVGLAIQKQIELMEVSDAEIECTHLK